MAHSITISGPDGPFQAYQAIPASANGHGLVLIQEIFGVNQVMRDLADDFASQGFHVLVPDLFWRIEPGIDITDQTPEEMQQAFSLFGRFGVDKGVMDIQATIDHLRQTHDHIGTVGYCLGGLLAYLAATRTSIDASVSYYGVGIQDLLAEAGPATKPLLVHIAAQDSFVNEAAQQVIVSNLSALPQIHIHRYAGLGHAFARQGGDHYDGAGAKLANQRTLKFLEEALA
jgi:carboxymethylenebutenolidase